MPITVAVGIYSPSTWTLDPKYVDQLRARFPDVRFLQAQSHSELEAIIGDADVAFSSLIRESVFARARKLRWIHSSAAGVGATLSPALIESPVVLTNSRGIQSASIAEHVLAMILAWRRGLHIALRRQQQKIWSQDELSTLQAPPFAGVRVLVVGMGSIGQETARLLGALGMRVDGVRREARAGIPGAESLPDLLPDADIVIITVPHTKHTDRLLDRGMLARMKPGSLLINTGRGRIIDEAALIDGLKQGRPGAAALDVFEREPLATDSPLWEMENVIVSPHIAGFGARFWEDTVELFARNFERWRKDEPLENVVDKRAGY
ncbi:MAG: D-2-hydroxyacid dehydrogenase [Vicinamibacterales bacterium]